MDFVKYNAKWPEDYRNYPLRLELDCIRKSGTWKNKVGITCGEGLLAHYKNARSLCWPKRYWHEWTQLIYENCIKNIVTILMGPGSAQKTSGLSEFSYLSWLASPDDTMVVLSTTTREKLDSAVFAEIKMLHEETKLRHDWVPGTVLESKHAITTDDLKEKDSRDMRKGIIGRACYSGGHSYVGLGVYAGVKQDNIIFLADELQFMPCTFFDCLPNMFQSCGLDVNGEPKIKIFGSGNPNHQPDSQLSIAAEPIHGWASLGDITKTTVWDLKFHRGKCVNLIGTDSPNMKAPEGTRPPYPRLISRNTMKLVEKRWGKNSMQWYSQCIGKMMMNMVGNRVITKELCENNKVFDPVVWRNDIQTRIGFLDPAWGGVNADRCVWGWLEFGDDSTGKQVIRFGEYLVVPFSSGTVEPDDQIARFCKEQARINQIEPTNIFYDSTGRGTIGAAFAKVFGFQVPVAVCFGDKPTKRPVRYDLFVQNDDGSKRLKRCDEEYGKFVTELWFSVRNVIECGQIRELTEEVTQDGYMREYAQISGGKIDVETKDETRERMGMSPDIFDALVVGIEGTRQRGFKIGRLGEDINEGHEEDEDFFEKEAKEYRDTIESKRLVRN
jgi:hypothetical protein